MPLIIKPMRRETKLLLTRLIESKVGEIVTYDELSTLAGASVRPVVGPISHCLITARRRARADYGIIFHCIHNVGLKRADDVGKVDESTKMLLKAPRAARRAISIAICVENYNEMPKDKQLEHNRTISIAQVVKHFSTPTAVAKIGRIVANTQGVLPVVSTLDAFRNS